MKKFKVVGINALVYVIFFIIYYREESSIKLPQVIDVLTPLSILALVTIFVFLNITLKQRKEVIFLIVAIMVSFFIITKPIIKSVVQDYSSKKVMKSKKEVEDLLQSSGLKVSFFNEVKREYETRSEFDSKCFLVNNKYYVLLNMQTKRVVEVVDTSKLFEKHIPIVKEKESFARIIRTYVLSDRVVIVYANKDEKLVGYRLIPVNQGEKLEFEVKEEVH